MNTNTAHVIPPTSNPPPGQNPNSVCDKCCKAVPSALLLDKDGRQTQKCIACRIQNNMYSRWSSWKKQVLAGRETCSLEQRRRTLVDQQIRAFRDWKEAIGRWSGGYVMGEEEAGRVENMIRSMRPATSVVEGVRGLDEVETFEDEEALREVERADFPGPHVTGLKALHSVPAQNVAIRSRLDALDPEGMFPFWDRTRESSRSSDTARESPSSNNSSGFVTAPTTLSPPADIGSKREHRDELSSPCKRLKMDETPYVKQEDAVKIGNKSEIDIKKYSQSPAMLDDKALPFVARISSQLKAILDLARQHGDAEVGALLGMNLRNIKKDGEATQEGLERMVRSLRAAFEEQ